MSRTEDLIVVYESLAASAHELDRLDLAVVANLVRAALGLIADATLPVRKDTRCIVCLSADTWRDDNLGIDFCAGCRGAPPAAWGGHP